MIAFVQDVTGMVREMFFWFLGCVVAIVVIAGLMMWQLNKKFKDGDDE